MPKEDAISDYVDVKGRGWFNPHRKKCSRTKKLISMFINSKENVCIIKNSHNVKSLLPQPLNIFIAQKCFSQEELTVILFVQYLCIILRKLS